MNSYSKNADAIAKLTPEQYRVTQQSGTERPGTGEYLDNKEPGICVEIISGEPLFVSFGKYKSGCGFVHRDGIEAEGYRTYLGRVEHRG